VNFVTNFFLILGLIGLISAIPFIIQDAEAAEIILGNAESVRWGDFAVSEARTNEAGDGIGSWLTIRGFDGIIFKTFGDGNFGTGVEKMRIAPSGIINLNIASGSSVLFGDFAVSVARTNTSGDGQGPLLNLRGFDGIVFRTAGDGNFGTGIEKMRIDNSGNVGINTSVPTQKLDVNGNIRLTGNIISPNDICIGTC